MLVHYYKKIVPVLVICSFLESCMVGPNFHSPSAPKVNSYTEVPLSKKTVSTSTKSNAGKSQEFVLIQQQDIPADWWYLFHSPEINQLVNAGILNSPTLPAAEAALRQAQEAVNAQIGNSLFPSVDAGLSGQRQRFAGATLGGDVPSNFFNIYNASVNVSYTLDIFGGARRQIESLIAQVDYQRYQLIAAYLTLTSNIVTTAVTVASLEEQITATRSLIKSEEDQLSIIRKQFELGAVAQTNVFNQETLVEQTRALLPQLEKSLAISLHSLSVLVGEFPNQRLPKINLEKIVLPSKLPVSLPSDLVRQRPDVMASEALLHAASAQIGVATANLFPQLTLTGNYGWSSSTPSSLFNPTTNVWSFGGQLLQPVLHGGALLAQRRGAIDAYKQAAAQYQQAVLTAFQNVADTLRALETDARQFKAQRAAEIAALKTLILTRDQYKLGGVNYLNLLTAQQQYLQTRINRIQVQAIRYADTAALFQAVGGGWWNCQPKCGERCERGRLS